MERRLYIIFVCSFLSLLSVRAQKSLSQLQYWIDDGEKMESTFSGANIVFAADASSLTEGLHTFYYRVKDSEGMYSPLKSWIFLRKGSEPETTTKTISLCQYWIDDGEKSESVFSGSNIVFAADATSLTEGLHTFYYRVKDSEGMYSPLKTWLFLRKGLDPATLGNRITHVEFWFDNDQENRTSKAVESGNISFSVDASGLISGLHKLTYSVRDELGYYCAPKVWLFYKQEETNMGTRKIAWLKYWWNNNTDKAVKESVSEGNTTYLFSKEVVVPDYAMTDDENHTARFCYVVGDDAGYISPMKYVDIEYSDGQSPVTAIETDVELAEGSVTLQWHTVSDVAIDYNVYYSEANGPFILWLPNTTKTTATFKGQAGKVYRFTVTARDKTGDQEAIDESKCVTVEFK